MNSAALQQAALNVAQALSPDRVLSQIVGDLAREPGVLLARIWLMGPGDRCGDCSMRPACKDQSTCLHLKASAGTSRVHPDESWTRTDGRFCRFPLGVRKVGAVGGSGEAVLLTVGEGEWLVEPAWAEREGLRCFAGQPLIFRGETLGVLAVFSRHGITEESFGWLRTFADHAATAVGQTARPSKRSRSCGASSSSSATTCGDEIKVVQSFGRIVGESPALRQVLDQV